MSQAPKHILLIEDDLEIAEFIETELSYEGYQVTVFHDAIAGINFIQHQHPDLVILDRMLPGMDGLSVCKLLRQRNNAIPIIMLTALHSTSDKVEGLNSGANDYLVKPFDLEELLARIQVQFRAVSPQKATHLQYADIRLDLLRHEVYRDASAINLTPLEFNLLEFFLKNPEVALSRQHLITSIWGWDYDGQDNILEVYIGYLRRKTEIDGKARLIHTVRGVGYILKNASS